MPWNDNAPEISVVIPSYQSAHCALRAVEAFESFVATSQIQFEVILVDDGSTDESVEILRSWADRQNAVRYVRHMANKGKGRSVADGIAAASAPFIAFTDVDVPYALGVIDYACEFLKRNSHIHFVVGSRRHALSSVSVPYGIFRRIASRVFALLARGLTSGARDPQCGFKMFRKDSARLLFSDLSVARFAFDIELFMRAKARGLAYDEVPVVFSHTGRSSASRFAPSLQMGADILKLYAARKKIAV